MNKKEANRISESIKKSKHRDELMASGAYDGRFKERVIMDKRFKKNKHKLALFAD